MTGTRSSAAAAEDRRRALAELDRLMRQRPARPLTAPLPLHKLATRPREVTTWPTPALRP
jgi:hypothetical protein